MDDMMKIDDVVLKSLLMKIIRMERENVRTEEYSDIKMVDRIEKMIADSPCNERITRVGNSTQSFLIEMMKRQHFFLFPSKEPCEGHSNALNEAMSQGLIPIVSDYHFNRAIVGDDRCVVNDFDSESYVKAIESIVENNQMKEISYYVWEHVKNHFSYSRVNKNIVDTIKQL